MDTLFFVVVDFVGGGGNNRNDILRVIREYREKQLSENESINQQLSNHEAILSVSLSMESNTKYGYDGIDSIRFDSA